MAPCVGQTPGTNVLTGDKLVSSTRAACCWAGGCGAASACCASPAARLMVALGLPRPAGGCRSMRCCTATGRESPAESAAMAAGSRAQGGRGVQPHSRPGQLGARLPERKQGCILLRLENAEVQLTTSGLDRLEQRRTAARTGSRSTQLGHKAAK